MLIFFGEFTSTNLLNMMICSVSFKTLKNTMFRSSCNLLNHLEGLLFNGSFNPLLNLKKY
jgi:hypothetical protein